MKKVYDPIHGFIHLEPLETKLISTMPFQRLQSIQQLGSVYLVYPGATHKRFEHSIGVMHVATKIYDKLCLKGESDFLPKAGSFAYHYYRKVLRLAALCHDLGHLPFSHTGEKEILGKEGHEKWTVRIILCDELKTVWEEAIAELKHKFPEETFDLVHDVICVAVGEKKLLELFQDYTFMPILNMVSQIITADLFGADRIDYLLRDARFTGLAYGIFDYLHLIENLIIKCGSHSKMPEIRVDENAVESCEALLLARHFMHKRLYQYPSAKSYSFHFSRFMKSYYDEHHVLDSLESYLKTTDNQILNDLQIAIEDKNHPRHYDAKRLLRQEPRFRALRLNTHFQENDILLIKKKLNISDEAIGWDIISRNKGKIRLSFPPVREYISNASNWVFVAPEYRNAVVDAIHEYETKNFISDTKSS